MNLLHSHRGWLTMLTCALLLVGGAVPYFIASRATLSAARDKLLVANAFALRETRTLQHDAQEEAALRRALGEKTFAALTAPPPRAQLVAALRQIGKAAGLQDFVLTIDQSTWLNPAGQIVAPAENLSATALHIKATAHNDRNIYDFTAQALEQLPGYIKLDRLTINRAAGTANHLPVIEAALDLRWLSVEEEIAFARQPPP
ncbi:MAG: hypothetical protein KBA75_04195 [Alphaproteobacteria bacterium]|nr:hypothetical protein [Alphaproteobacteria bacterium]